MRSRTLPLRHGWRGLLRREMRRLRRLTPLRLRAPRALPHHLLFLPPLLLSFSPPLSPHTVYLNHHDQIASTLITANASLEIVQPVAPHSS